MITVQSRAPGGPWEVRNSFLGNSPSILAAAHRTADLWRNNYTENRQIRVHDSMRPEPVIPSFEADHV